MYLKQELIDLRSKEIHIKVFKQNRFLVYTDKGSSTSRTRDNAIVGSIRQYTHVCESVFSSLVETD